MKKRIISFSQWQKFQQCPEFYRMTYLAPLEDDGVELAVPDQKFAAIGTYIQHIFDNLITKHFYNPDFTIDSNLFSKDGQIIKELENIVRTEVISCDSNTITQKPEPIALEYLSLTNKSFTVEHNYDRPESIRRVQDEIIEESVTKFLNNWNYLFTESRGLKKLGIKPTNCRTEVKVYKTCSNFDFMGFVDFLFETDDGTVILDGKLNKNLFYAEPTQLLLYAWALDCYDSSTKVGFVNYTLKKAKMWRTDSSWDIERALNNFAQELYERDPEHNWEATPAQRGQVKGHCKWCPLQNICTAVSKSSSTHKQLFSDLDDDSDLNQFRR